MGLISGRVQKAMKIGLLVQEVLRQQSKASAGHAELTYLLQEAVPTRLLEQNFWELYMDMGGVQESGT